MMNDKLSAILAGENFSSTEIQGLINEITADQAEARQTLEALKETIEKKRLESLGKPASKEIKAMETEAAELENIITTMNTALQKLQGALEKALASETESNIRQIDEAILALESAKTALLPEFFKSAAKSFSLYAEIFGESELTISKFSGPVRFWSREMQVDFHDALEKFAAGRKVIPHEISILQSQRKFLTRV